MAEPMVVSPSLSYLLCATPRSGSTLLCRLLSSTDVAGYPNEYFEPALLDHWRAEWNMPDGRGFFDRILSTGTSANRVFGCKVMWPYLHDIATLISHSQVVTNRHVHRSLIRGFPRLCYIRQTRNDKLRQAISLYRALETQVWTRTQSNSESDGVTPEFNGDAIKRFIEYLTSSELFWDEYFAENDIKPLTVVYEQFVEAPENTTIDILKGLGVRVSDYIKFSDPGLFKQADSLTEEWAERYMATVGRRSGWP